METEYSVEVSSEGQPLGNDRSRIMRIATDLQEDAMQAMKALVSWHQTKHLLYLGKESIELSLILSDDCHIQELNRKHLNADSPTDVLSFPMDGGEDDGIPMMLLGDIVLSLDTAERQAKQMGHDLHTECRILLVHSLLHLFGYDHDRNEQAWTEMANMEKQSLEMLGWKGTGLISNTKRMMLRDDIDLPTSTVQAVRDPKIRNGSNIGSDVQPSPVESPSVTVPTKKDGVQLVALDMDGTLLTSDQRITDGTKEVIEEAIDRGMKVVVATGKARPGAITACQKFGLYGEGSLISHKSAGVFLQGLVVHTLSGAPMDGPTLSADVVRSAFEYASETGTSCVAFTGDECVTLRRTPDVVDLHEQCFEPLAKEVKSVEKILEGRPVKKIVMISSPEAIRDVIQPHWNTSLQGRSAVTTMAVANMVELVPRGMNKWIGLNSLLESMSLSHRSCMAVGDGRNDYEMIKNVGIGVAMGNAVEEVKSVADHIVSSNDNDGIVEAFEKLILS